MGDINEQEWKEMVDSGYIQFSDSKEDIPVIVYGFDFRRGKVYAGHGRITAKFIKPDKKGRIVYNGKKYFVTELKKSEDYKEWH
jgi:hypothetical protein